MIIPDDMIEVCGKVFGGEYDIPSDLYKMSQISAPTILDIGANIGSFSRWAKYRWPNATVHAYEPLEDCYEYLIENTKDLDNVFCNQVAVSDFEGSQKLYHGTHNRGMSSLHKSKYTRETSKDVEVIDAKNLPKADIVKCDTEGSEVSILKNLNFSPTFLLVEYHSNEDKYTIEKMYQDTHILFEFKLMSLRCGTLKFIRNDI